MLYIVGTSIGNIQDTSYRALKTLLEADVILAEDTRTFHTYYERIQDLFSMYAEKEQVLKSLHSENEFAMLSEVAEILFTGKDVALVSESGMPAISDPGGMLIKHVRLNGLPYTVIPGPSAFVTAAIASGIPFRRIYFVGFLEKKESALKKQLFTIKDQRPDELTLIVCYESPHRVKKTLTIIREMLKPKELVLCRELTKKFEEVISIVPSTNIDSIHLKGELAILFTLSK